MRLRRSPRLQSSRKKRKLTLNPYERGKTLSERRKAPRGTNQAAQTKDERGRVADTDPGARRGTNGKKQMERRKRERDGVAARRRRERRSRNVAEPTIKGASPEARTGKTKTQERTERTARVRAQSNRSSLRETRGTSGRRLKRQRTERPDVNVHGAEKESVTSGDAPGPGPGPDREDVVDERGHATEVRASDEAAAGTGSHADQEAGIKEIEAESTREAKRMKRRRATLNLMTRRAKRAERETRALKSRLVKNAGAEREVPNGDVRKAAAAPTATRTNAKNAGRAKAPKAEREQKTNHAAPRRITRMRKRTRAPVTVTDTSHDGLQHPLYTSSSLRTTDPHPPDPMRLFSVTSSEL